MEDNVRTWTLDGLVEEVASALEKHDLQQASERVREHPDARTVRYYATLGLIDRPVGIRARRKLYGERHRQQLLAIKRLQSLGLTLAQVQERMLGITPVELADLARVEVVAPEPESRSAASRTKDAFWRVRPRVDAASEPPPPEGQAAKGLSQVSDDSEAELRTALSIDGLTLVFDELRPVDDADLKQIRQAAGPLVSILRERGLLPAERR